MAPAPASLCISELPCHVRSVFNQLRRVQCRFLRFSSHLQFLNLLKVNGAIPVGLLVKSSANLSNDLCHRFHQQIIHQASSSIVELTLLQCSINITSCIKKFIELSSCLRRSVNEVDFHQILNKLHVMGQIYERNLLATKKHKLSRGHYHIIRDCQAHTTSPRFTASSTDSDDITSDSSVSIDMNGDNDTGDVSSQVHTKTPRSRRWIKRTRYRKLARRGRTTCTTSTNTVVNLSNYDLKHAEKAVLSNGLKYVPTPRHVNTIELQADITQFSRRLRLRERFFNPEDGDDSTDVSSTTPGIDLQHPLLKKKSTYTPPSGRDPALDAYITAVENEVLNKGPRKVHSNITNEERRAISDLKNNSDIVIKEADKGSAIVIMNTDDYLSECHRQLDDTTYYQPVSKDLTAKIAGKVTAAIKEARSLGIIDEEMESALKPDQPKPGRFYILPKIHKKYQNFPPGRPIISGSGTATEKISLYVDLHLKPHVKTLSSYVEDDNDFLRKIMLINNQHGPLPNNTILCTMDVTSLYSNIPNDEFISSCQDYLTRQHTPTEINVLTKFMELTLKHNNFELAGDHFVQVHGTAMGTRMAPSGACLFMGRLEEQLLATAPKTPLIWLRYIDDVFLIWTHGEEELDRFILHCNAKHHTIKFTAERSYKCLPFLDVMVELRDGHLHTDLYSKPTDTHQYLQWSSCHPRHTKESLPYSLAFRLRRICSSDTTFTSRTEELENYLHNRGYPSRVIKKQIQKVMDIPRSEALRPRETNVKNEDRVPFVITYDPSHSSIASTIHKYLPILHSSKRCKDAIPKAPMVAFRRPMNIKDMIVRSAVRTSDESQDKGFSSCNTCAACKHTHGFGDTADKVKHTVTSQTFSSHFTGEEFTIKHQLNCLSTNVIYLISCKKCDVQYVGETKRSLKTRLLEHCGDTKHNRAKPVSRHFNLPNHCADDILIMAIDRPHKKDMYHRQALESKWIEKLQTFAPFGMNIRT